jgi:hypothetical protein
MLRLIVPVRPSFGSRRDLLRHRQEDYRLTTYRTDRRDYGSSCCFWLFPSPSGNMRSLSLVALSSMWEAILWLVTLFVRWLGIQSDMLSLWTRAGISAHELRSF